MPSIHVTPDEILRQILYFVSPDDNLSSIQPLSKRFYLLANEPLLWRYHCRFSFRYWHDDHGFHDKLQRKVSETDWKALYLVRKKRNARLALLLDSVLATKVGRLRKFEQICLLGYDAKDFLLEQCNTSDAAEDVLARRYYANTALDSINRGVAVDVWSQYQGSPHTGRGLERALGAFDMFVLHDQPHDLSYITSSLDNIADQFRAAHPNSEELSTRQRSLALVRWLRAKNLTGMSNPEANYRNIRNCLLGHALSHPEHDSLPIISSALFCAVAERLGMKAACCAFPNHVHASVFAPAGQSLDGAAEEPGVDMDMMYLDPYGSDDEVTIQDLRLKLLDLGWVSSSETFLRASPAPVIVQRTAQNIRTTYVRAQELPGGSAARTELRSLRAGHPDLNLEAVFYGSMWAQLLMTQAGNFHWDANLNSFLNRFALTWSEDAWIVEKYLVPIYDSFLKTQAYPRHRVGWENVRDILKMLHNLDQRPPTVSRRYTQDIRHKVHFRIGQVFRHKRYGYVGIINGWAAPGTTTLPAPHYMSTDEAEDEAGEVSSPARRQTEDKTYYTCLRPTLDRLRVAQQNIEIITEPSHIPASLFFLAGKFFKRFDKETCTFVSNIKEFYPDD